MVRFLAAALAASLFLAACATAPPTASEQDNVCEIFDGRKSWYRAAARAEDRWGAPVAVQMAIIKQESGFDREARPARGDRRFLGLVRGRRPSSAYGYAQALDGTWDEYRNATGNRDADRKDFSDSVDFVGWYIARSSRLTGIAPGNARAQYLAYHEGPGGYSSGGWQSDRALIAVADRVAADAGRFERQLDGCERRLKRRGLFG